MRITLAILAAAAATFALAQQTPTPTEIDPNTKTEGGADVNDSGASAGGRMNPKKPRVDEDRQDKKDKPIAERKPGEREQERESEDAAKGATKQPQ